MMSNPAAHAGTGSPLVYLADVDGNGTYGIYRDDVSTYPSASPRTVLADGATPNVERALLSPDGLRIAALVGPPDGSNYSLQVMNLDGSNRHVVAVPSLTTYSSVTIVGFDWLDASTLVFGHRYLAPPPPDFAPAADELMTVSAAGGRAHVVTDSAGLVDPAVNPVTGKIAAIATTQTADPDELVVYSPADHSRGPTVAQGKLFTPTWSPDGSTLAFGDDISTAKARSAALGVVDFTGDSWQAFVGIPPSDDGYQGAYFDENPRFAPDGSLWFDRPDESLSHLHQDLWQAVRTPSGWALTNYTASTHPVASPSFGPADTTAPGAATFRPFQLAGTTTVVNWTPPADVDYSHVVIDRTNPDGTHKTIAGYGHSYADRTVVGATYHYRIQAVVDGAGNTYTATTPTRTVRALAAPKVVVSNPTALTTATKPFTVAWRNSADPSGTRYVVQYATRGAGGTLASHTWFSGTTAGLATVTSPVLGQTYYFRAKTIDAYGNASATTGYVAAAVAYDQGIGFYSAGWSTITGTHYWLGSERVTHTNGAFARFTVTSRAIALLGDRLPSGGSFKVYVGRTYEGTFPTASSTTQHRRVLYSVAFGTTASRTVTVVAVVASSRSIGLDAIAASR